MTGSQNRRLPITEPSRLVGVDHGLYPIAEVELLENASDMRQAEGRRLEQPTRGAVIENFATALMIWHQFEFFAPRQDGPIAIAHRGGAGECRESSLEACRFAASIGLRFIELDLRAATNGKLAVWHGKGLERTRPNQPLDVHRFDRNDVTFFEDILEELPSETRFFVDLKNNLAGEALACLLRRTKSARRICVGSFSHNRTTASAAAIARETGYSPCTAMTPRQAARLLLQSAFPAVEWRAPYASAQIPAWMATRGIIRAAHAGGALVFAWTVNDKATMHTFLNRGVDGLMTDYPTQLAEVLSERGACSQRAESVRR